MFSSKNVTLNIYMQSFLYIDPYLVLHLHIYP